jgi:hypothetical protein
MIPIALSLSLFLQAEPAAGAAAEPQAAAEAPWPAGAPRDDYLLVAWCYGLLRGYLDLHDPLMPEVTRIEAEFRPPGRKLSDDLRVYAEMQKTGKAQLKQFQAALTAAEKASLRPINIVGARAVAKGHAVWEAGPEVTKARMAQEWMSWALPARCETTAKTLQERATLMGAGFKVNEAPQETPPEPAGPQPSQPAAQDMGALLTGPK